MGKTSAAFAAAGAKATLTSPAAAMRRNSSGTNKATEAHNAAEGSWSINSNSEANPTSPKAPASEVACSSDTETVGPAPGAAALKTSATEESA